ncbi:MAG: hypothetical protein NTX25_09755 [Proteobacteria bacterium]|nr:hypothetical protein [Pseudomonadota bacterium]
MDRLGYVCGIFFLFSLSCRTPAEKTLAAGKISNATLPASSDTLATSTEEKTQFPHPNSRQMEQLQTWLAAQKNDIELQRIDDCQAQIIARADHDQSKIDLQRSARELRDELSGNIALYHWCYYNMIARLNYHLEQQALGSSYQDRLQQFLREGKALYILARALDRELHTQRYRQVLTEQYVTLSQTYFGRILVPAQRDGELERPGKNAGPFEEP